MTVGSPAYTISTTPNGFFPSRHSCSGALGHRTGLTLNSGSSEKRYASNSSKISGSTVIPFGFELKYESEFEIECGSACIAVREEDDSPIPALVYGCMNAMYVYECESRCVNPSR